MNDTLLKSDNWSSRSNKTQKLPQPSYCYRIWPETVASSTKLDIYWRVQRWYEVFESACRTPWVPGLLLLTTGSWCDTLVNDNKSQGCIGNVLSHTASKSRDETSWWNVSEILVKSWKYWTIKWGLNHRIFSSSVLHSWTRGNNILYSIVDVNKLKMTYSGYAVFSSQLRWLALDMHVQTHKDKNLHILEAIMVHLQNLPWQLLSC